MERRSQDPPRNLGIPARTEPDPYLLRERLEPLFPLRVMRVITRLNVGGPSVQATRLTRALSAPEFVSTLVTGREDEREGNYLSLLQGSNSSDIDVVVVPTLRRSVHPLSDSNAARELLRLFRLKRPDIVHTHMAKAGTIGRLAAMAAGVPVVVHTFHGNVFQGYFSRPVSAAIRYWERLLATATDALIAISNSQAAELYDAGIPRSKVRVVPLGVPLRELRTAAARFGSDADRARRLARARLGMPTDAFCVAWVARLVDVKDPELMVRAVAALARERPSTKLLVVGDGPLREKTASLAEELGVDLSILSWTADLAPVYLAADVVALSSRNEGLPVALIEALALGRPVASTDVGGVADLFSIAGCGVLAASRSPEALADAIRQAAETPAAQLAVSSRRITDAFDESLLVERIKSLYMELAFEKAASIRRRRERER